MNDLSTSKNIDKYINLLHNYVSRNKLEDKIKNEFINYMLTDPYYFIKCNNIDGKKLTLSFLYKYMDNIPKEIFESLLRNIYNTELSEFILYLLENHNDTNLYDYIFINIEVIKKNIQKSIDKNMKDDCISINMFNVIYHLYSKILDNDMKQYYKCITHKYIKFITCKDLFTKIYEKNHYQYFKTYDQFVEYTLNY